VLLSLPKIFADTLLPERNSSMRKATMAAASLVLACSALAQGEDFRIESRIYAGDDSAPIYRNLTLFQRHIVYDFFDGPAGETTIYESAAGTFTLLDPQRKVKTTLDRDTLGKFVAGIKVLAAKRDSLFREAAEPKFEISFDDRLEQLHLKGKLIHYAAQGQPFTSDATAREYREFVDMYTRLNATQPNSLPPFARLELNAALAGRGICPTMVERKILSKGPLTSEESVIRSEHTVTWRVLESDQRRIDIANNQRAEFEAVDFGRYRRLDTE
jgi:hypothetical protein